jgi:hypothetical protein
MLDTHHYDALSRTLLHQRTQGWNLHQKLPSPFLNLRIHLYIYILKKENYAYGRGMNGIVIGNTSTTRAGSRGFEGGRNNIGRKSEVLSQIFNSSVGKVEVVILPIESFLGEALWGERLHQAENFQIGNRDIFRMLS